MRATDSLIVIQSQPAGTERVWSFSDQEPVRSLAVASPAVMCYPALLRVVCNVFVSPDRDQRTGVRRFYKAATTPSFLTVSIHFHLYSINNIVSFQVLRGNTFTFQVACHKESYLWSWRNTVRSEMMIWFGLMESLVMMSGDYVLELMVSFMCARGYTFV